MLKLFRYLKAYIWQVIVLVGAVALQVWCSIQLPAMMADIVNNGIVKGDLDYIWTTGVLS